MRTIFVANVIHFKEYSQFKSIKDFNNNIEQWMVEYKSQFTPSELIALKRLTRFCTKVYGIATASIKKILEAINEKSNGFGISRSTFKRMLTKAKKIGLLEVKEMVRKNMSQSANLYIFQRFTTNEPPRTEQEQTKTASVQEKIVGQLNHPKTSNQFKTNNINNRSTEMDHTYVPTSIVDSSFIEAARPFFDAEKIYGLWGRVKTAYKRSQLERPLSEVIESVNRALKQTVFMYKQGKIQTSFEGYFYRLSEVFLGNERRKEVFHQQKQNDKFYNWLD